MQSGLPAAGTLAAAGATALTHAWLIDPIQRTLEGLRLEHGHWVILAVHAGQDEVRAEPFDATILPLGRLWVD